MEQTKQILKDIEALNQIDFIKVDGTDKDRVIFKNEEVFKIFSDSNNEEGLNPFNDYSYKWLNSFLSDLTNNANENQDISEIISTFEDNLNDFIDSEVSIYNHDLLKWLRDSLTNYYYMEEVVQEGLIDLKNYDFIKHLQIAQYKAIENAYFSFLSSLKTYLNNKYETSL